jgi:hypothetical protein
LEKFFAIEIGIEIEIENKGNTNIFDPDFDPERHVSETIKP